MRLLFRSICELRGDRTRLEDEMERAQPDQVAPYHAAKDAADASEVGCGAVAGGLILLLAGLLGRFKGDLKPRRAEWEQSRPNVRGHSVGQVTAAAANAFRHADEWAKARHTRKFTTQQTSSMSVLRAALAFDPFAFSDRQEWEQALDEIGHKNFDHLANAVLRFANDVALIVQARGGDR